MKHPQQKKYLFLLFTFVLMLTSSFAAANKPDETMSAMKLTPNKDAGKKIYELCAACHEANGWGKEDGSFPVIAGQHRSVIIKQLADIRARNRENPTMYPFSGDDVLGGPQGIGDVAEYISQLPPNPSVGIGPGEDLDKGKKIFEENCAACHGKNGEGNAEAFYPRIQGQHYAYILRQLKWIRDGRRKNANPAMLALIKNMDDKTLSIIADYVSRLTPKKKELEAQEVKAE